MRTWTHSLWCSNAPGCALFCTRCSWCVFLDMECARLGRALLDAHFAVLRTCFSVCVPSCASDCTCLWSARMLEMRTLLSMRCARLRGVHSSVLAPRRILLGVCSFSWLFYLFFFLSAYSKMRRRRRSGGWSLLPFPPSSSSASLSSFSPTSLLEAIGS